MKMISHQYAHMVIIRDIVQLKTLSNDSHIFAYNSTGVKDTKKSMCSKLKDYFNTRILNLFPTSYVKY